MRYNVVLLPEERVSRAAIEYSAQLPPDGRQITLGWDETLPHVSLYMLMLEADAVDETLLRIKHIAQECTKFALRATRYNTSFGYFDVEYEKPSELTLLQQQVLEALNPLRSGMYAKDGERLRHAQGERKHNLETYGWASIGSFFRPHLTITKYSEDRIDIPHVEIQQFSGDYPSIALVEMAEFGTARALVSRFDFSNRTEQEQTITSLNP